MKPLRDWRIGTKLAFSSIASVLGVLCFMFFGFFYGFINLKDEAIPAQKAALSIRSETHYYLSELSKFVNYQDQETISRIKKIHEGLLSEIIEYAKIAGASGVAGSESSKAFEDAVQNLLA